MDATNVEERASFGRRAFIKGAAASLGAVALAGAGCAPQATLEEAEPLASTNSAEPPAEEIYQGVCRGNCGGGCRMNVHVRDGKVVKTSVIEEENPLDSRICQRGLTHAQRIYAPERIEYPMRRVEGTERGAGEWERLTWDEAIDYIATKWKGYIEEYGGSSLAYDYGAGTYAVNYYVYMRLFNLLGGTQLLFDVDQSALPMDWRIYGNPSSRISNHYRDILDAKYIFNWAANTTTARTARWVYNRTAMERGAKTICIDPIYTGTAEKADIWVPIKAGTDSALALSMMKVIVDENLQDDEFLMKFTVAPFLVRDDTFKFLRMSDLGVEPTEGPVDPRTGQPTLIDPPVVMGPDGATGTPDDIADPVIRGAFEVNGIKVATAFELLVERVNEWPVERAAEVTTVDAETIKELARMYAEGPTTMEVGFGNDHYGNGTSATHCHLCLPLITGQVGKPGAGMGGTQNSSGASWPGLNMAATVFPEGAIGGISESMLYLPQIMETGKRGDMDLPIKSLLILAANPLANHNDYNALKAAWDKIELIIHCETVMNDTARYADVLLPVPHWFEYETFSCVPLDFADINEAAIPAQFECKTDIEICRLLGVAMGLEQMDITDEEYHRIILDTDYARGIGLDYDALREKKRIRIKPEDWLYGREENPFATTTGRAEFFIEDVQTRYGWPDPDLDTRLRALPFYEEPTEVYDSNPLREKYPLILISHRDKFKVHTTFAPCPWLCELQPEPTVQINPVDASTYGIQEGDYVRLYNDRGQVVVKATLDASMQPGMMWTEHTWLDTQYIEGRLAELLPGHTLSQMPNNAEFDTLVAIEKYSKEA